ncbi:MAG TPA: hypothetical protein VH143_21155 [Kofleriaceae bacterium]|jgi:hypothetical protein|nr:hypothetical protein [Kofleriaceae bacterium]
MSRIGYTLAILASSVLASACTDDLPSSSQDQTSGSTSGGAGDTFDHDDTSQISPWDLLNRLETQGPPEYTAHVHSCAKVKYKSLLNVLTGVGADMTGSASATAGELYNDGASALGAADYANRIRENIAITTSGMSREFDIFAAAAPSIITAFQNNTIARCPGTVLFDSTGCRADGISCLLGANASIDHVAYCNATVSGASSPAIGQTMAVAAILAAAYTCE